MTRCAIRFNFNVNLQLCVYVYMYVCMCMFMCVHAADLVVLKAKPKRELKAQKREDFSKLKCRQTNKDLISLKSKRDIRIPQDILFRTP